MNLLKIFKLLIFLIFISFPGYTQDKEITVTGSSEKTGENSMIIRERALKNAFRKAVEMEIETLLQCPLSDENTQQIFNNVYKKSEEYLKNYSILEEGRGPSNDYIVTIRAVVDIPKLVSDLWSPEILQGMVERPKILSVIDEKSSLSFGDPATSNAIEEQLNKAGFDLVDRAQVEKIRKEEFQRMGELWDNEDAIARLAQKAHQEYGAQYLLMGIAVIEPGSSVGATYQADATFKCKIVDASTAEKVALTQKAESGKGKTMMSAILYAGQRVGEIVAAETIPQIIQNWFEVANRGIPFIIKLYGVTSYGQQALRFIQAVKNIPGVTNCAERLWDVKLGRLELDVAFKCGNSADLMLGIFEAVSPIPGFENFDKESQIGNNINFRVK